MCCTTVFQAIIIIHLGTVPVPDLQYVQYNPADTIGDFGRDFPNLTGYCKNFHISEHSRCSVVGFLSNTEVKLQIR